MGQIGADPSKAKMRRIVLAYVLILVAAVVLLAFLHLNFSGLKAGGVKWFDLDRERNIATWFSGLLFFLITCAAVIAFLFEQRQSVLVRGGFPLHSLWLGVAAVSAYMSLDEITILHENLFWRQVRLFSADMGDAWAYLTQWQILFAPALLLVMLYFVLFFSHRFRISRSARLGSDAAIACWLAALLLEGLRGIFRDAGPAIYSAGVLVEEVLEMSGAICLAAAIVFYIIDTALDENLKKRQILMQKTPLLNRHSLRRLGLAVAALILAAMLIFYFAHRLAERDAPLPGLFKKAIETGR